MAGQSGGIASAFGFRYQYLITVEILLELFETSDTRNWAVDVDRAEQDSADILVYHSDSVFPERVIQVKASLPESSTTIGKPRVRELLDALADEHSAATARSVVTNRTMTAELAEHMSSEDSTMLAPDEQFEYRNETLIGLTETLLQRIRRIRSAGGVGPELYYLLLRQLIDIVHEAGSRPTHQRLAHDVVRAVIEGATPVLSNALGARSWGTSIEVPRGNYIARADVSEFLKNALPTSAIYDGAPQVAVIHGMSGAGKTSVVSRFARSRLEHFAFVLWLDASSPAVLESQLTMVLDRMGLRVPIADPTAQDLMTILSELPVPWLLVMDGADSLDAIDEWVPRSGYGQTVITTTRADWPTDFAPSFSLGGLSYSEAHDFFAERFKYPKSQWSAEQRDACDEIAHRLSYWPLALELTVSWMQRRGASIDGMCDFAQRLERLNLDDTNLLPHGYPKTATQVIIDLLSELSLSAQRLAAVLLFLGADRVPERLIADWAQNLRLTVHDPLEELFASSIMLRGLSGGTPHDYDETLSIHAFLKLVAHIHGVELDGDTVSSVIETCEQSLEELLQQGRFREASALIQPVDHMLSVLLEGAEQNPWLLVRLSMLMHNLAQLAVLISNFAVAETWYIRALNIREVAQAQLGRITGLTNLQLQTLAGVATVMARKQDEDGLNIISERASALLKDLDESISDDLNTLKAIQSLRENGVLPQTEGIDQIDALNRSYGPDEAPRNDSPGAAKIHAIQHDLNLAIRLVEIDLWQQGLDAALAAANQTLEEKVLVDSAIGCLLDVGLLLVTAIARRQHEVPVEVLDHLQHLSRWFDENPTHLDETQQQRRSLLQSVATGNARNIRAAVGRLPETDTTADVLAGWSQIVSSVADQIERLNRHNLFSNLPNGVTVEIGVDGGDDINFWHEMGSTDGVPRLWVCTASRIRYDSTGKIDPLRESFIEAGLPKPNGSDELQPAHDWAVVMAGDALTIHDGNGTSWVKAEGLHTVFCQRVREVGGLVLLYGDRALVAQGEVPPQGWVALDGNWQFRRSNVSAGAAAHLEYGQHVTWLDRLKDWWKWLFASNHR